ncbi:Alpha/Beta hydrolase protein [Aspergillus crustosus]
MHLLFPSSSLCSAVFSSLYIMGDYGSSDPVKGQLFSLDQADPEFAAAFADSQQASGGFFTSAPLGELRIQHTALEKQSYEITSTLGTKESVGKIRMRDGYDSEIRIFRPSSLPDNGGPLIVLIFGGGYLVGTNMQLVPFARSLSALYNATAITVSYRLAPEYPFPTAPEDIWDSLKWIAQHATLLGADPSKGFILGGVSAGGHLTTLTAQRAVKEKLSPPLTGIWASVPVTTLTADSLPEKYRADWVSRVENANAPILNVADINEAEVHYKPDVLSDNFTPYAHRDLAPYLPPAYIQVVGMDPLRDDGLVYERYLKDNGVKTRLDFYPGVPHCHYAFHPELESSKKFRRDVALGVGWLLGEEVNEKRVIEVAREALGLEKSVQVEVQQVKSATVTRKKWDVLALLTSVWRPLGQRP